MWLSCSRKKCFKLLPVALFLVTSIVYAHADSKVLLGIDVLQKRAFRDLEGKAVGLLTNPAGVDSKGTSSIEILHAAENVRLVALFGPEHGIRGDEKANEPVPNRVDQATGLPVYSLYGPTRKPTPEMLKAIDLLVIDLQDIGVRSYTYISCMRLAVEACFEQSVEVMILDRPNPLGGLKIDGPGMEQAFKSYVGAFPIPYIHGLTIGEIALISKKTPGWLEVSDALRKRGVMTIIPMVGWKRSMTWADTGLQWRPTSPSIPTLSSVLGYAMLGLGAEINGFRHGYGTNYPFRLLTFSGLDDQTLKKHMDRLSIPGVAFKPVEALTNKGKKTSGLYVQVTNWEQLAPTELSFAMMPLSCALAKENPYAKVQPNRAKLYNKHVGSKQWWDEISSKGSNANFRKFLTSWEKQNQVFRKFAQRYWIYE